MSQVQSIANGRFYGGVLSATRSGELSLAETTYAPGFHVPPHEHPTPFVCVVLAGSFVEEYERSTFDVGAGAMFYHPGPGVHAERFGERGGRCFVAQMESGWLDRIRSRGLEPPEHFVCHDGDRKAHLAVEVSRAFRGGGPGSMLEVEGLLALLLADLVGTRRTRELRRPRWLERATEVVHARYLGRVGLADLAAEVDVHPSHLARSFSRFNGCTVGELVRRLRLDHARALLAGSDRALSDIALSTGFADQSHFSRAFKRRFGVTPGAYRRTTGGADLEEPGARGCNARSIRCKDPAS